MKKTKPKLNPQQEYFCKLYATDKEFFGNGVESYIEAYDIDVTQKGQYQVAGASASRLLKDVRVCDRIREQLELGGFTDEGMDKELLFVAKQYDDLSSKMSAIKEYNKLKKRVDGDKQINNFFSLSKLFEESTNDNK